MDEKVAVRVINYLYAVLRSFQAQLYTDNSELIFLMRIST